MLRPPHRATAVAAVMLAGQMLGCTSDGLGPGIDELVSVVTLSASEMTTTDTVDVVVATTNPTPYPAAYLVGSCGGSFVVVDSEGRQVYPGNTRVCTLAGRHLLFDGYETKERTYRFDASLVQDATLSPGTYRFYPGSPELNRWPPVELRVTAAPEP